MATYEHWSSSNCKTCHRVVQASSPVISYYNEFARKKYTIKRSETLKDAIDVQWKTVILIIVHDRHDEFHLK